MRFAPAVSMIRGASRLTGIVGVAVGRGAEVRDTGKGANGVHTAADSEVLEDAEVAARLPKRWLIDPAPWLAVSAEDFAFGKINPRLESPGPEAKEQRKPSSFLGGMTNGGNRPIEPIQLQAYASAWTQVAIIIPSIDLEILPVAN